MNNKKYIVLLSLFVACTSMGMDSSQKVYEVSSLQDIAALKVLQKMDNDIRADAINLRKNNPEFGVRSEQVYEIMVQRMDQFGLPKDSPLLSSMMQLYKQVYKRHTYLCEQTLENGYNVLSIDINADRTKIVAIGGSSDLKSFNAWDDSCDLNVWEKDIGGFKETICKNFKEYIRQAEWDCNNNLLVQVGSKIVVYEKHDGDLKKRYQVDCSQGYIYGRAWDGEREKLAIEFPSDNDNNVTINLYSVKNDELQADGTMTIPYNKCETDERGWVTRPVYRLHYNDQGKLEIIKKSSRNFNNRNERVYGDENTKIVTRPGVYNYIKVITKLPALRRIADYIAHKDMYDTGNKAVSFKSISHEKIKDTDDVL